MEEKFCKFCGEKIPMDAVVCKHCGRQVEELKTNKPDGIVINNVANASAAASANVVGGRSGKARNKTTAIVLCCLGFIGIAGLHKFYEGKILSGIIYLFTVGFLGIGTILSLIGLLGKPNPYYV